MDITHLHTSQPRRVGIGNAGLHHLGHVLVGIIVKESWAASPCFFEISVRKKTGFNQSLEPITDTNDETAASNESIDGFLDLLVEQDVDDKLS